NSRTAEERNDFRTAYNIVLVIPTDHLSIYKISTAFPDTSKKPANRSEELSALPPEFELFVVKTNKLLIQLPPLVKSHGKNYQKISSPSRIYATKPSLLS